MESLIVSAPQLCYWFDHPSVLMRAPVRSFIWRMSCVLKQKHNSFILLSSDQRNIRVIFLNWYMYFSSKMNFEVRFAKFKQYVFPYNVQIYDYSKKNSFKSSQTILRNKKISTLSVLDPYKHCHIIILFDMWFSEEQITKCTYFSDISININSLNYLCMTSPYNHLYNSEIN